MLCRVLVTVVAISYLICVLVLSGVQKDDLDSSLLEKLQRHNIKIDELNDDKLKEECLTKSQAKNDGKEATSPSDSNEADSNKKSVELILNGDDKVKMEENLSRTIKPANLEAILKYFNNKQKARDKSTNTINEKGEITTSYYESTTKENSNSKYNEDLTNKLIEDHKKDNSLLEMAVKYWTDMLTKNKKLEPKNPSNIEILVKNKNFTHDKENLNMADIENIMKFLSEIATRKQSVTKPAIKSDTNIAIKELNHILGNIKNNANEDAKLNVQTTPHVQYISYDLDKHVTEESAKEVKPLIKPEGNVTHTDNIELQDKNNYAYLRTFTVKTPADPDIPKHKYNYYLQSQPIISTAAAQSTDTTTVTDNFKGMTETDKEIKLSKEMIRQIAESVKDIVLTDLKKQFSTESPGHKDTTTDANTTIHTLANATIDQTSISTTILSDGTTNTDSSLVTQPTKADANQGPDSQMAKEMAKIVALLSEMKVGSTKDLVTKPSNIPKTRRVTETTTDRIRIRTYVSNGRQTVFSPLFLEVNKHPELMPPPLIQGQHPDEEKSIIPWQQRTPNEMNLAPLLIQTNSDQIPPLSIPLMKPSIMNLNIVVTTESPFQRLHLSQDKWNRAKKQMPQREKIRRKVNMTKQRKIAKKPASYKNHTDNHNTTDCLKFDKDHVLLNKTDEIMSRLKNIESLFANLTTKNVSKFEKHEKPADNTTNFEDLTYFRQRQNNKVVQYFKNNKPEDYQDKPTNFYSTNAKSSDAIDKKIKEIEIRLACIKQLKKTTENKEVMMKPLVNSTLNYAGKELANEEIINRIKSTTLGKFRLANKRPKIGENIRVYAKKTEEIDIRLKNLERDINNLRQQIKAAPKSIDQQLNNFKESNFKNIEAKYHKTDYAPRYTRARSRIYPRVSPQNYVNVAKKVYSTPARTDILSKLKDMNIRLYKSASDDGKTYNIEPINHYVSKAKENVIQYRDGQAEHFDPYKDLVTWRTTRKRSNKKEAPKFTNGFDDYAVQNEEIIGFHKKLETAGETSDSKTMDKNSDDNVELTLSRQMVPIQETITRYDDTNFNNFLKTQQKVNSMLERILATKTEPEEEVVVGGS